MAIQEAKTNEIPTEQVIFNSSWALLKKYHHISPTATDEEWEALIEEANSIYKMGKDKPTATLSKALALGVIEYIDTLTKQRKGL